MSGDFTIEPIFGSPLLVALVAAALGVAIFGVGTGRRGLPRSRRMALAGLRLAGLLVLLAGMLRPAYIRTDTQPAPADVAVLLDGSRSMTLASGEGAADRWSVQRDVWRRIGPALVGMDEALEVRIGGYASGVEPLDPQQVEAWLAEAPAGNETDVAGALAEVLGGSSGRPLAGVVLVGDGTQTAPLEGPTAAASVRTLAALQVPLLTVPIGPRVDDRQRRDVAVEDLADQFRAFSKNQVEVVVTLRGRGMAGQQVPLRIALVEDDGTRRELARRQVVFDAARDTQLVRVPVSAPESGSYRLEVEAEVQDGEVISENNRMTAFLDVREGGGRILYLEGQPRVEQLFLRRAINESRDFQLAFRWIETGPGRTAPEELGDLLSGDQFDVIIIGDLPASALGREQLAKIARLVASGKGLVMIGGFQAFDGGGYGDSPLAAVMPVQMESGVDPAAVGTLGRFQWEGLLPAEPARSHPITRLSDRGGDAVWKRLPPLRGGNRLGAPKAQPGVQVVLQTPDEKRLLVVGEFGRGRVAAFAGDTTWRWWRHGASDLYRQFWRQMILWLLARDDDRSEGRVWAELESRRMAADQAITFHAGAELAEEAAPVQLAAEITRADGFRKEVRAASGLTGEAAGVVGQLEGLEPGFYRLRVTGKAGDKTLDPAEVAFQVTDADRELARPIADIGQLEQLAAMTAEIGGRAFAPDEIDELVEAVRGLRRRADLPVVERWRLGDGPVGGWLMLALLTGILGTEWTLRRLWQLP